MPQRPGFTHHLIRPPEGSRRPFSTAYAALWLHLALGVGLFLLLQQQLSWDILTDLAIASLSISLVLYGIVARRYLLLSNLVTYALALNRALTPDQWRPVVELGPLLITLTSTYLVLAGEYRNYLGAKDPPRPLPLWLPLIAGCLLSLLGAFGFYLIWPQLDLIK